MMRIYVPGDSAALALGAEAVARAVLTEAEVRDIDVHVVRNGSRGMIWLEPLVEVETDEGRVGFGPMTAQDVPALFDDLAQHPKALGNVEELPFFAKQTRLTFARCGLTDPLSLEDYWTHGGFAGLTKAVELPAAEIVQTVTDAGLRGRGGAGFPTGIKWKTVADCNADQKYVVCNADEGDSGTFADRMIMEGDPFVLIEGMIIAGLAVRATKGYVYLRSEYPDAIRVMNRAVAIARKAGIWRTRPVSSRAWNGRRAWPPGGKGLGTRRRQRAATRRLSRASGTGAPASDDRGRANPDHAEFSRRHRPDRAVHGTGRYLGVSARADGPAGAGCKPDRRLL